MLNQYNDEQVPARSQPVISLETSLPSEKEMLQAIIVGQSAHAADVAELRAEFAAFRALSLAQNAPKNPLLARFQGLVNFVGGAVFATILGCLLQSPVNQLLRIWIANAYAMNFLAFMLAFYIGTVMFAIWIIYRAVVDLKKTKAEQGRAAFHRLLFVYGAVAGIAGIPAHLIWFVLPGAIVCSYSFLCWKRKAAAGEKFISLRPSQRSCP